MTLTLIIACLWGMFLSLFVLSPLLSASKKIITPLSGRKSREAEKLFQMQELLLERLLDGVSLRGLESSADSLGEGYLDSDINSLSEQQALNSLYDVCERLEAMGLSWKETFHTKKGKELGACRVLFLVALLSSLAVLFFAFQYSSKIFASEQVQPLPPEVTIPPPTILSDSGYWLPSVNQYILMPAQGILHVYYVGMFSNNFHARRTKILLPFPKDITDVSIHAKNLSTLETQNTQQQASEIVLNTLLSDNVNQIQAEFSLQANSGSVRWQKNSLAVLPGVAIVIMPEYSGVLRSLLAPFFPNINLWPARIVNFPSDFKSLLSTDVLKADSINSNSPEGELSRQFVRVGNSLANFPEFKVVGLVPSRFFLYLLVLFFACFFVAALIISILKLRS